MVSLDYMCYVKITATSVGGGYFFSAVIIFPDKVK